MTPIYRHLHKLPRKKKEIKQNQQTEPPKPVVQQQVPFDDSKFEKVQKPIKHVWRL